MHVDLHGKACNLPFSQTCSIVLHNSCTIHLKCCGEHAVAQVFGVYAFSAFAIVSKVCHRAYATPDSATVFVVIHSPFNTSSATSSWVIYHSISATTGGY